MKIHIKSLAILVLALVFLRSSWASDPAVTIHWSGVSGRGYLSLSLTTSAQTYNKIIPYGEFSTAASLAASFGAHISADTTWPVWAKGYSDGTIKMRARTAGLDVTNIQVCVIPDGASGCPAQPSGVSIATGGVIPSWQMLGDALYGYQITQTDGSSGYDAAGNVIAYQDTVNQQWTANYDALNRIKGASQTYYNGTFGTPSGTGVQQYFCWIYDSFGNRKAQIRSSSTFADGSSCQLQSNTDHIDSTASYGPNNRLTSATGTSGLAYDASGNLTEDGTNSYLYDADGNLCAVWTHVVGMLTGYVYDASGHRVAKGTLSSFSCDPAVNGFSMTTEYIPGPDGEQMTELAWSGNQSTWMHTNVFSEGSLLATYDSAGVHFHLNDWLGSRRMQVGASGNIEASFQAAPFGDLLSVPPTTTEHYFTGKERDAESGLDNFGARYYTNVAGRWMSPDWSEKAEAIPHAVIVNPQSFNLYQYGLNNPLSSVDPDGHAPQLEYLRRKAVRLAWEGERRMVAKTGTGTRPWTAAERAELLETGKVAGYVGHHINSVKGYPELAGNPNNVEFVEGASGNLARHGGNFQNITSGEMLSRSLAIFQIADAALNAIRMGLESNITGTSENIVGNPLITDPVKAAVTLDGATITTYSFWSGENGATYSVQGGQYIDANTHKAVDPKVMQGRLFYFTSII